MRGRASTGEQMHTAAGNFCQSDYHPAMPERPVPFSLLDAARVVARGGTFDEKLAALTEQVRTVTDAGPVGILLHDADADVLLSLDGELALPVSAADAVTTRAVADRQPVLMSGVAESLRGVLDGSGSSLLAPLVVEDEDGAFLEGLLALGWEAEQPPIESVPDPVLAIADLAAVTIRQARLRNSVWEQSDHADRLSHTDRLTGLANRVTFERMLELEIARATRQGTPLAVAVVDVDGLTGIGEDKGARVADEVLRHVASAIAERVRLLDTVARFGEDEFVVIAPGDAGGIVALRLRDAIADLPPVGDTDISVSAAVVHHPADGATGAELVAASEAALASAKQDGPGTVFGVQEATA